MSNMIVLGEKNKETISATLYEGTVTKNTISSETGEVTGFNYTSQLNVGDFVTVHEDSTKDNLMVEKYDSDADLPVFGMIINEPVIKDSENGERKAGLLILGNIIRFRLDEEAEITVNDKITLSEGYCTSSDNGHYYALFSVDGDEYNYLDVFLPFATAANGSSTVPSFFVFPNGIFSYSGELGDYYGSNDASCGDIGDYAVITDPTKIGFGKVYQVCNFGTYDGEIKPKTEASYVFFNAVEGISWTCPQPMVWIVPKLEGISISKSDFPNAQLNDFVIDFNTGNLYKISMAAGNTFYLSNLSKTVTIPTPNFGVTTKPSSGTIAKTDVTMNNSAEPKFGDYIIATGDNYVIKVTGISWGNINFTRIYQFA